MVDQFDPQVGLGKHHRQVAVLAGVESRGFGRFDGQPPIPCPEHLTGERRFRAPPGFGRVARACCSACSRGAGRRTPLPVFVDVLIRMPATVADGGDTFTWRRDPGRVPHPGGPPGVPGPAVQQSRKARLESFPPLSITLPSSSNMRPMPPQATWPGPRSTPWPGPVGSTYGPALATRPGLDEDRPDRRRRASRDVPTEVQLCSRPTRFGLP